MKNVHIFLLFAILSLSFASCSKEDPEPKKEKVTLLGTWILTGTTFSFTIPQKGNVLGEKIISNPKQNTVTFTDDGFYDSKSGDNQLQLTINGMVQTFPNNSSWGSGLWQIENGVLQLTGQPDATIYTFNIKTLTSTTLELESSNFASFNGGAGVDGASVQDFHLLITLKRK